MYGCIEIIGVEINDCYSGYSQKESAIRTVRGGGSYKRTSYVNEHSDRRKTNCSGSQEAASRDLRLYTSPYCLPR